MKLTHKAIARMAGYRVESGYESYPNLKLGFGVYWKWHDVHTGEWSLPYNDEHAAWKGCCETNGLINDEEDNE